MVNPGQHDRRAPCTAVPTDHFPAVQGGAARAGVRHLASTRSAWRGSMNGPRYPRSTRSTFAGDGGRRGDEPVNKALVKGVVHVDPFDRLTGLSRWRPPIPGARWPRRTRDPRRPAPPAGPCRPVPGTPARGGRRRVRRHPGPWRRLPVKHTASTTSARTMPVCGPPRTQSNTRARSGTLRTVSMRGATKRGVCSLGLARTGATRRQGGYRVDQHQQQRGSSRERSRRPDRTGRADARNARSGPIPRHPASVPTAGQARSGSSSRSGVWRHRSRPPRAVPARCPRSTLQAAPHRPRRSASHQPSSTATRSATGRAAQSGCAARSRPAAASTSDARAGVKR